MAFTDGTMSPADYAAMNGNDGFGGNNAWWIILFFLLCGNGWGGYGYGSGNADATLQRGFDQNAVMNGLANISNGMNDIQLANMQQMFNLQSQFANCCCENRLGIADLKATAISENCADRQALNEGVRDIIANQTANTQAILDKMYQQELDAERRENANLRTRLNMMNLAASQNAQTGMLMADNTAQTLSLLQRLDPNPIPAYIVANPNTPATTATGA